MTDITKLPDEWIAQYGGFPDLHTRECAEELEQALPVWTRITEDESTWPEGLVIVSSKNMDGEMDAYIGKPCDDYSYVAKLSMTVHWRPLCSIDTPPETES